MGCRIMMSRAERSLVGDWWWTVDRAMLAALAILMISGLVLLMAGGPPGAERLGPSTFPFFSRPGVFLPPPGGLLLAGAFPSLWHGRPLPLLSHVFGMGLVLPAVH